MIHQLLIFGNVPQFRPESQILLARKADHVVSKRRTPTMAKQRAIQPCFAFALWWICCFAPLHAQGFVPSSSLHHQTINVIGGARGGGPSVVVSMVKGENSEDLALDEVSATNPGINAGGTANNLVTQVTSSPRRSIIFSFLMAASGAALGPFLDSFHSAFGVLQYNTPMTAQLWGSSVDNPALITSWWVPELFGLAGFLIGWLYILFDAVLNGEGSDNPAAASPPSPPKICLGISFFTFQYWLSGVLFHTGVDRTIIGLVMTASAVLGFYGLDRTRAGFLTSVATAMGGPLIEVGLLQLTVAGLFPDGYHYTDLGETGYFPLWIVPVYFLGGPANGNLARGFWSWLSPQQYDTTTIPCDVCQSTRCVPCPNCDGIGSYAAMGNREVTCTSCRGRGFVICRSCFNQYGEDPNDIEAIRELMASMPD